MKNRMRNLWLAWALLVGAAFISNRASAQDDTCNYDVCQGMNNPDLRQLHNDLKQIKYQGISEATYTFTATYSRVTAAGTATITAGAYLVSIANTGEADAQVNGVTLEAGSVMTFPMNGAKKHPQITYDALTSRLQILVER